VKVVSDTSAFAMNQCFTSALDIAEKLNTSPEYNTSGTNHRTLLVLHCCASYEQLPVVLSNWNKAWKRSINDNGNGGKRRRSNVAVIIVRVIFISPFLFYCLLYNHSFPTNPNSITNCFELILSITTLQLHCSCVAF
jgi:hypothetical protein